jgi:hypothetical protein
MRQKIFCIGIAVTLLLWRAAPALAQNNVLDLKPADVNSDGDVVYEIFNYNRLFSDGKFIFEALHLRLPGLDTVADYNELSVGGGYRLVKRGGFQLYGLAHVAFATADQKYLQPAALMQFASGKWAGSAFVQRYIALTDNAASAWLIDPAEIQYSVAGPVAIGASAYLYRPNGGSALTKIGPKVSVADKYGATELRVVHVNQGASTEFQIRRIILF